MQQRERDEKHNNNHRQTQALVCVYANNDTISDNELPKSKQSIEADIDKIVVENKHFRMVTLNFNFICYFFLVFIVPFNACSKIERKYLFRPLNCRLFLLKRRIS